MRTYAYGRDRLSRFYADEVLPRLRIEDVFSGVRSGRKLRRHWRVPCPLHGGRDANFAINTETLHWYCHSSCQTGGDAVEFVMRADKLSFREAVLELARRVGADTSEIDGVRTGRATRVARPVIRSVAAAPPHREYPPVGEVEALWGVCGPVTTAPTTVAYLQSKRIDPMMVADMGVVRALPMDGVDLPSFAGFGPRNWRQLGYHLIAPMRDEHGVMRSLDARSVFPEGGRPRKHDGKPMEKSLAPRDYTRAGLVMTCPLALQILQTGSKPEWWTHDEPLRVEICEGSKKMLQRIVAHGDANEFAPAVIGVVSGSWSDKIAARLPDGAIIYIATDPNKAGAAYATEIVESLLSRIAFGAIRVELREQFRLTFDQRCEPTVELVEVAP